MHIPILNDILIIFLLSIVVIVVFNKIKIPAIVGYLITGILAGPYVFELIQSKHDIEILAEIGIILFLFTLGMEFSLSRLIKMKKMILISGSVQVLLTIIISSGLSLLYGTDSKTALLVGFFTALSSTAIVLKIVQTKGYFGTPQGNFNISILIYQDIMILPMFLIIPLLSGSSENISYSVIILFVKIIGILLFLYVSVKYLMPFIINLIVKTRIKELFYIAILLLCFGIVWLASLIGISPALGAFLAGIIISETEYDIEAISLVEPFKDIFTSFFFVSVGMMLDINFLIANLQSVVLLTFAIIIIKVITGSVAVLSLKYPLRIALLVGFFLAQIGEFSLVLSKYSLDLGLISGEFYQLFLSVAVFSMAITPFIASLGEKIATKIKSNSFQDEQDEVLNSELVIIGYGLNGKNISIAAKSIGLKYSIIEMNPDTVQRLKNTENIIYGDASNEHVLMHSGIKNAKTAVIVISDPNALLKISYQIKKLNPEIHLIVRTRYLSEMTKLYEMGADDVIPEEFETSIEITARIMSKFLVPESDIQDFIQTLRGNNYQMFRKIDSKKLSINELIDTATDFAIMKIDSNSEYLNKKLKDTNIRQQGNVSVIAIKRNKEWLVNPSADEIIVIDDKLLVFGERKTVKSFCSERKS
jgi:CPA2 family monovalent cation:H+ antiporter-2